MSFWASTAATSIPMNPPPNNDSRLGGCGTRSEVPGVLERAQIENIPVFPSRIVHALSPGTGRKQQIIECKVLPRMGSHTLLLCVNTLNRQPQFHVDSVIVVELQTVNQNAGFGVLTSQKTLGQRRAFIRQGIFG